MIATNRGHRLTLDDITQQFGDFTAVRDINLDVAGGELVALLGPSGCGKSTLLRIMSGFIRQTNGRVLFDGQPVDHLTPSQRGVGIVFQNYALFPHMTVAQNVAYGLQARQWPRDKTAQRVDEMLALVHMSEFAGRKPRQLSGGQRQRVAMGRAIVRQPKVFLFDEPLSNLDAKLRVQMRTEIKKLHKRVETTMIYVTHDQVEAMTLADRVVVMRDGHVEQIGTPDVIYNEPASIFVAGFIGAPTMNLVTARVEDRNGMLVVALGREISLALLAGQAANYRDWVGREVIFGLRPEQLAWARSDVDATTFEIAASVVEPLGADTLVFFEISGLEMVARVPPEAARQTGDRIRLRPDLNRMHLFNPATGRRITQ